MKIGLLMLPFVCVAAVAMAADEREPVVAPEPGGAAPGMSPPHYRMINSKKALFEKLSDQDEEVFKTLSRQELIELLQ